MVNKASILSHTISNKMELTLLKNTCMLLVIGLLNISDFQTVLKLCYRQRNWQVFSVKAKTLGISE